MATHFFSRSIPKSQAMASFLSRSHSTATSATSLSTAAQSRSSSLSLLRSHGLRPLAPCDRPVLVDQIDDVVSQGPEP
ncbi:hypothetical protein ACFX12_030899 [Malus domestica]